MITTRWAVLLAVVLLVGAAPSSGQTGTLFVEGENVGIGTANPTASLHVKKSDGSARLLIEELSGTAQARELLRLVNPAGPFMIFVDSQAQKSFAFAMFSGNFLILHQQTGGAQFVLEPNGNLTISGSYFSSSSREVKDEIVAVDPREILDRVMELPVSSWKFKAVDDGVRHIGPMAEDFQAAFGLGGRDDVISTLDTSGVTLAAIQGLRLELEERDREISRLRQQLEDEVGALKAAIETLQAGQKK